MSENQQNPVFWRIYLVVQQIPAGQLATYGQIAKIVGGCNPRVVGYAMAGTPHDKGIPWHRVINSQGHISIRRHGLADPRQLELLIAEGVLPNEKGRFDLRCYLWDGPDWKWCRKHGFHWMQD